MMRLKLILVSISGPRRFRWRYKQADEQTKIQREGDKHAWYTFYDLFRVTKKHTTTLAKFLIFCQFHPYHSRILRWTRAIIRWPRYQRTNPEEYGVIYIYIYITWYLPGTHHITIKLHEYVMNILWDKLYSTVISPFLPLCSEDQ